MDPPPQPRPPSPQPTSNPTTPQTHTYHCLCSTLLLATPYRLSSLPQRAPPSLDSAVILPLPPPPLLSSRSPSPTPSATSEEAGEATALRDADEGEGGKTAGAWYSMVVGMTVDRKPVVVRREDGFEKRWVWRCGRCRVGVGYSLGEGVGEGEEGKRRREGGMVVYLLPGGLVGTREMMEGEGGVEGERRGGLGAE